MARMELFGVNNSSIKAQSEIIFWMNENLLTHEGGNDRLLVGCQMALSKATFRHQLIVNQAYLCKNLDSKILFCAFLSLDMYFMIF